MRTLNWISAILAAAGALTAQAQTPVQAPWQLPTDPATRKDYVAKLIATVQKAESPLFERFTACRELSVLGDQSAIPVLAALLSDETMAHMARYGLEPNPDPAVDEALRAALDQVKGNLLIGAIDSIGIRRDAKAVNALAALLASPDADLAAAAAASLGRIATPESAAALGKACSAASGQRLVALADGCIRTADALCAAGKCDAAKALFDQVRASSVPRHIRMAATRGAILARGKDGISLLIELLKGEDPGLAAVALRVTYEMSAPELTQALAAELPRLPESRQAAALQALGSRQDPAPLPALLAMAKTGPAAIRVAAIRAACQTGSSSALPTLAESCLDPDAEVAAAAQAGLAGFPGQEADAAVIKLINSPDPRGRCLGVELAGQRRQTGALPVLIKAASDADRQVAGASLKVLGEIGGAAEIPALIQRLLQGQPAAENALSAIAVRENNPSTVDAVCAGLPSAPLPARLALLRVLGAAGGAKSLATMRTASTDADAAVKDTATRALCDWKTSDAAEDQLALAKTSPNPTYKVLALRGYIRSISDPDLSAAQRQAMSREASALIQREAETKLLLGALGSAGDVDSLTLVVGYLGNPGTKEEASAAAVTIAERLVNAQPAAVADAMQKVVQASQNQATLRSARRLLALTKPKPAAK